MSRITRNNLLICMLQLLITEGVMIYPVFYGRHPLAELLAPISLLTYAPMWALRDRAYLALLAILSIDILFLSTMTFSIIKNHKLVSGVCLLLFNVMGIGFIAAGY
jgi:hypothetical protein